MSSAAAPAPRAVPADPAQRLPRSGDEHVYPFDPSGELFEIAAEERTVRARGLTPASARMLAAWKARELSG
jgi:hypothetical protein